MSPADGTTPIAVNVKKLSEDQLIALEHAQGEFEAAVQDYEAGEGAMWFVNRKWAAVVALGGGE
jgi:hypothetical protein